MKTRFWLCFFFATLVSINLLAQLEKGTSNIQAGGGFAGIILESTGAYANGYLVNGSFEKWLAPSVGIGGSVHYVHVRDQGDHGTGTATSFPVYMNGDYYFGKEKFRVFVKASVGFQFSWRKLEDTSGNSGSDHDAGFTAGVGTGVVYTLTPKVLVNLNYSMYWMKNAYYSNGLANTVSINFGYMLGH